MFRSITALKLTTVTISLIVISFLFSGCSNNVSNPSSTTGICAHYTNDLTMPQTQSPQKLSDYMTGQHTDYHVFGWDISASLIDNTNDTIAFFISIERVEPECRAGVGFNSRKLGGYKWNGFTGAAMQITNSPWSATLTSGTQFVKIQLVSGLMGSANAVYRLTADVSDLEGKSLKVNVELRDPFGAINQGYGTASFYPQYLTDAQRSAIMALPEKSVGAYLAATGDQMTCQGDYYYALPLMNVGQFAIDYDTISISGTDGKSWMDYFVQSYDAASMQMTAGSTWNWIAIQLPEINSAINVLKINNSGGTLPYARLFSDASLRSNNGARKAVQSWEIDNVFIEPVAGTEWTSPSSGKKYAMKYNIRMVSPDYPGDLTVTMLQPNQEVVLPEGVEYQGLGLVEGTLNGQAVHGRCWLEVQPVQ